MSGVQVLIHKDSKERISDLIDHKKGLVGAINESFGFSFSQKIAFNIFKIISVIIPTKNRVDWLAVS